MLESGEIALFASSRKTNITGIKSRLAHLRLVCISLPLDSIFMIEANLLAREHHLQMHTGLAKVLFQLNGKVL